MKGLHDSRKGSWSDYIMCVQHGRALCACKQVIDILAADIGLEKLGSGVY